MSLKNTPKNPKRFSWSEDQIHDDNTLGGCIACGEEATGVEPDACNYTCESCGAPQVFGAEELVIMGLVDLE